MPNTVHLCVIKPNGTRLPLLVPYSIEDWPRETYITQSMKKQIRKRGYVPFARDCYSKSNTFESNSGLGIFDSITRECLEVNDKIEASLITKSEEEGVVVSNVVCYVVEEIKVCHDKTKSGRHVRVESCAYLSSPNMYDELFVLYFEVASDLEGKKVDSKTLMPSKKNKFLYKLACVSWPISFCNEINRLFGLTEKPIENPEEKPNSNKKRKVSSSKE